MKSFWKIQLVAVSLCLWPSLLWAQSQSSDGVWERIESSRVNLLGFETVQGTAELLSTVSLNRERLKTILGSAPREFTEQAQNNQTIITVPYPDGTFERFRVEVSPVIDSPLESAGFETQTYKGVGIDDPTATIRFEQSFDGFHAMVRSSHGVFFVDPVKKGQDQKSQRPYVSYFARARRGPIKRLHCEVKGEQGPRAGRPTGAIARPGTSPVNVVLKNLRTYRLALAANSYYVAAVYDKTQAASPYDQAATALTRTVNRVNEIYEAEFGIHLQLVPNERLLIYVDPNSDPYRSVNSKASAALPLNQTNLDKVIGAPNYDIGHLFTTDTAGLAALRSVCNAGAKAQGVTGIASPVGDDFDVDYVSHEIGHQFGANHTFNAISSSCNGNRNSATAYEPGSGSTIMGYAGNGICDPESLQDHSDPYFHLASLLEIEDYVADGSPDGGGSCGASTPISFLPPTLSASGSYTVPKGTPFILAAQVPGRTSNPTIFNWEEYDLGDPAPPDNDSPPAIPRPLFRSAKPGGTAYRLFPDFEALTSGGKPMIGESMPSVGRTMAFRVVGRNNHGSFSYVELPVNVYGKAGPFKILSVAGGNVWSRGSSHLVRWDKAGTDRPPIKCPTVELLLGVDGDPANWFVLAKGVANSGSFKLTVPADAPLVDQAFLIVKSENNVFLAVHPFALQITEH